MHEDYCLGAAFVKGVAGETLFICINVCIYTYIHIVILLTRMGCVDMPPREESAIERSAGLMAAPENL